MTVPVALIAAVAENGVIGSAGKIPWYIPSDFAWFKRTTMGKPIVMGRKQFESVGRPLPGRDNIVLSRQPGYQPDGVTVVQTLAGAIHCARCLAETQGASEVMVIGGGEIYAQAIGQADRLYISHVALSPEGDVFFPEIDADEWAVVETPELVPDPRDSAPFRVNIYARRNPYKR